MKKLIFAAAFLFLVSVAFAQGDFFDLGIKAGINSSKISTDLNQYNEETINNYNFGAFARLNIGRIYVQPEAYYSSKGGEVIEKVNLSTINKFDLKALDVPVLAGLKIINKEALNLRIMGGPVFSYITDKEIRGDGNIFDKENIKDSYMGWQLGAGIDFLMLTFDVRMESSGDMYDGAELGDSKNKTYLISLGIKLM